MKKTKHIFNKQEEVITGLFLCIQVVSLLHYDDAEQGTKVDPSPGYPLVCINVSMAS